MGRLELPGGVQKNYEPTQTPHDEKCRAKARTREEQYSLLKFFFLSLRFLSFNSSQDSVANGALVIARFLLMTGIRPVSRKSHNAPSSSASSSMYQRELLLLLCWFQWFELMSTAFR
jgi:hypothetical protein